MLNHQDGQVDELIRAMAHGGRRAIVRAAMERDRASSELATIAGLSRPAATQHLRVLLDAGVLSVRRDGRNRWYRAEPAALEAVHAELAAFWEPRLATLKAEAER